MFCFCGCSRVKPSRHLREKKSQVPQVLAHQLNRKLPFSCSFFCNTSCKEAVPLHEKQKETCCKGLSTTWIFLFRTYGQTSESYALDRTLRLIWHLEKRMPADVSVCGPLWGSEVISFDRFASPLTWSPFHRHVQVLGCDPTASPAELKRVGDQDQQISR